VLEQVKFEALQQVCFKLGLVVLEQVKLEA